jgi:hypothetical protein
MIDQFEEFGEPFFLIGVVEVQRVAKEPLAFKNVSFCHGFLSSWVFFKSPPVGALQG